MDDLIKVVKSIGSMILSTMEWMVQKVTDLLDYLFNILWSVGSWFLDMLLVLLLGLLYYVWIVLLYIVKMAITLIHLPQWLTQGIGEWANLPSAAIYMINALGLSQGMAILASAYLLRFLLNIIPASLTRI